MIAPEDRRGLKAAGVAHVVFDLRVDGPDDAALEDRRVIADTDARCGLTEALRLCEQASESGFKLLIGCMVCTSLGIAPARVLASTAQWVDLDGPLLLAHDRDHGLSYHSGKIDMSSRELWG